MRRGPAVRRKERSLTLEPILHVNLTDQVYRAIKDRVLSQDIAVGSRLRDEDLAAQLRVSRTPVREALMRLAQEGLVEIVPRSGTRVRNFTFEDIEHIFDVRIALEALAIRKAIARISDDQITHLRALHEQAEVGLRAGNTKPALEFDREMHRVVLESSGNKRLQEIMASINDLVSLFRNIGARTPFHRGYTYRHRDILRAMERRDADAAAAMLAEHIEVAKQELFRDFQQRKLQDSVTETRRARTPGGRPDVENDRARLAVAE